MSAQSLPTDCIVNFWKNKFNIDIHPYYAVAKKATSESRLRLLHFKIIRNIYPTNILLSKMKVKSSNECETCKVIDFIEHFFVNCKRLNGFWDHVTNYILTNIGVKVNLSDKQILCGIVPKDYPEISIEEINFINHVLLIGKMGISKMRYGKCNNIYLIFELDIIMRATNGFLTLPHREA